MSPLRDFNRTVLSAFLSSGVIWIAGFSLGMHSTGVVLTGTAVAYVTLSSLALASRRPPTGRTLLTLWVTAVLILVALTIPVAGWMSLIVGGLVGSILFAAWSLTGFLLLQVFTGRPSLNPSHHHSP